MPLVMPFDFYDPIGNRTSATDYDEQGNPLLSTYTANALNQYTSRTVPGYAAVRGEAATNATVTVNERWHIGVTPSIPYELMPPAVSCPFTPACNGHDKCYWTCNSDRAKCDDDFRKGMNALCDECRKNNFLKYDPRGYIWLLWCKEVAFMYYLGVRAGGWYDYDKFAQPEACEDCCCDEGK